MGIWKRILLIGADAPYGGLGDIMWETEFVEADNKWHVQLAAVFNMIEEYGVSGTLTVNLEGVGSFSQCK